MWVADFAYVSTWAAMSYVAFVIDSYARRILGWRLTTSKTTPLVHSVLEQALFTRRRHNTEFTASGLVHHSDASQYTSLVFTEALLDARITGSIGSVGDALDNALMESAPEWFRPRGPHYLGHPCAFRCAVPGRCRSSGHLVAPPSPGQDQGHPRTAVVGAGISPPRDKGNRRAGTWPSA